ncbi:response regulator [Paenibacillus sacheonensis]|uniref:Response regulator n=1 Tax=Paenibacillus sacheonensis TaxID=742054 RepID=A0A7X4YNT2_9BACL|nr:response regulator [Paenibacillus sacheonensis]
MSGRILVVDDDSSIVKITKLYLTKHGYEVDVAYDGRTALDSIRSGGNYALNVLDLMLPRVDGWAVCRELRQSGDYTPIIMLTARGEVQERIEGIRMGADDYLVKPFDPNELLARVEAVLRRTRAADSDRLSEGNTLVVGNLLLRLDAYAVYADGEFINLTKREFDLLAWFARRPEKVFSREDLIAQLWGWDYDGENRVVDLYIQRIRRKLGTARGWNLTTVWGVGYKFEVNVPC